MMPNTTKTIGPLHFEDLEPRRFEDLVRQLVYDFKNWRNLEATGRAGSDDGFDIRGYEILYNEDESVVNEKEDDDEGSSTFPDRLWQIQCKREKVIPPAKLKKYTQDILSDDKNIPYGLIFVASCDFSKKARDMFVEEIRTKGVQEFHLWGKAELEDMLFQPKNDHLLFAYFGISLLIRKRNQKTWIRSMISTKKKIIRILGDVHGDYYKDVLIRDVNDKLYPFSDQIKDFKKKPAWKMYYFLGHYYGGIRILIKKYYAYFNPDTKEWDYVERLDLSRPFDDEWNNEKTEGNPNWPIYSFWNKLPKNQQYYYEVDAIIPYENIVEVDAAGDPSVHAPHLFVDYTNRYNPFIGARCLLVSGDTFMKQIHAVDESKKIKFFPEEFPEPEDPLKKMGSGAGE